VEHLTHALFLGQTRELTVTVDARDPTPGQKACQWVPAFGFETF
jgi:hypothetical protein